MFQENPYKVLGLPIDTEFNEVRARYFYLARKHHPDKLSKDISEAERVKNEEYFKTITVAYHQIDKGRNNNTQEDDVNLIHIWKQVETFFSKPETWECMKDILQKVSKMEKVKKTQVVQVPRKHQIKVDVTLQEVHNYKDKKLRLFLSGINKPVYITVKAADVLTDNIIYLNNYLLDDNETYIDLTINLVLKKSKIFRVFRLIDKWDIFYDVTITWYEYITGKTILLTYLDSKEIEIDIPEYYNIELPIIVENRGLCNKGDLFIIVKIDMPKDLSEFKEILEKLNAIVIDPGLPEPKSI